MGLEERPNGIHVTNIYPGEVATPILANRPVPVPPERVAQMLQPEDIATLVVAIAQAAAACTCPGSRDDSVVPRVCVISGAIPAVCKPILWV